MNKLYKEIAGLLTKGDTAILATIIEQAGSAPRKSGAQMVIRGDGSFLGSVGGGRLEAECLTTARTVMSERRGKDVVIHLTGTDVAETAMICGGGVEVFIEPLSPGLLIPLHQAPGDAGAGGGGGPGHADYCRALTNRSEGVGHGRRPTCHGSPGA